MEPSPSAEPLGPEDGRRPGGGHLPDAARHALLDLAADALLASVRLSHYRMRVPASPAAASNDGVQTLLSAPRGVFVTVTVGGGLNGCVGAVETDEPLAVSVPRLARQAAFADPRLPALRAVEVPDAAITVSVLGPLEPMEADTAEEVARLLRLGVDGLLLRSGLRQATFLPAVAVSLPDPLDFVHFLERKAGWRPGEWPPGTRAYRYAAEEFGRPLLG